MEDKAYCSNYFESSETFHGALHNVMGTRFDMVMIGKSQEESENIFIQLNSELYRLHRMLNRFDATTELAQLNANAHEKFISLSSELWEILCDCRRYHEMTNGLFDVTKNDFTNVLFRESDTSVSFASADISIDLGGYVKGYALLQVQKILEENGVGQCFVDFGSSSILGIGHHPYGDSWKVSMDNPYRTNETVFEVNLFNQAMSVSGNKPDYSGHIIHPVTKNPINERKAVCVVCKNPLDAEVLTTTIMVASPEEKEAILAHFEIDNIYEYKL